MAKGFITLVFSVLFIGHLSAQVIYTSPRDGSLYHSAETSILIRTAEAFQDKEKAIEAFQIIGSESGVHHYSIPENSIAEILLLDPVKPFVNGEEVTILQKHRIEHLEGFQMTFHIGEPARDHKKQDVTKDPGPVKNNRSAMPNNIVDVNINPTDLPVFFKNTGATGNRYYGIANNDGTGMITFADNSRGKNFDLRESGYLGMFDDGIEKFLLMDSSFNTIDTFEMLNGYTTDMHEFLHFPDGSSVLMAYDPQIIDMSVIVAGGDTAATVSGSIFQLLDPSKNLMLQWRSWDHFLITDSYLNLTNTILDYAHLNSVDRDGSGNFVLSSRNMDEVTLVDGATGDIIWRLGGMNNMFTLVGGNEYFSRQHDARVVAEGAGTKNITVYDNGLTHLSPISSAREFIVDTTAMTATLTWNFDHPLGFAANRTGNAQRLANGNTFINWGNRGSVLANPNFTEVDPNGNVVWEFRFTDSGNYNVYRGHRHAWDTTSNVGIHEQANNIIQLYPNPASEVIRVRLREGLDDATYHIVDLTGRLVDQGQLQNQEIAIAGLRSGLYMLTVETKEERFSIRFEKR